MNRSSNAQVNCAINLIQNLGVSARAKSPEAAAQLKTLDEANRGRYPENDRKASLPVNPQTFGISVDDPVYCHSACESYTYVNQLWTEGGIPLYWERLGSTRSNSSPDCIDIYCLYLPDGNKYGTIYVNMYSSRNWPNCPKGYRFYKPTQQTAITPASATLPTSSTKAPAKSSGQKFCRFCGTPIIEGSKFCRKCGKALDVFPSPVPAPKTEPLKEESSGSRFLINERERPEDVPPIPEPQKKPSVPNSDFDLSNEDFDFQDFMNRYGK